MTSSHTAWIFSVGPDEALLILALWWLVFKSNTACFSSYLMLEACGGWTLVGYQMPI